MPFKSRSLFVVDEPKTFQVLDESKPVPKTEGAASLYRVGLNRDHCIEDVLAQKLVNDKETGRLHSLMPGVEIRVEGVPFRLGTHISRINAQGNPAVEALLAALNP
jgi:hypothetical protein